MITGWCDLAMTEKSRQTHTGRARRPFQEQPCGWPRRHSTLPYTLDYRMSENSPNNLQLQVCMVPLPVLQGSLHHCLVDLRPNKFCRINRGAGSQRGEWGVCGAGGHSRQTEWPEKGLCDRSIGPKKNRDEKTKR